MITFKPALASSTMVNRHAGQATTVRFECEGAHLKPQLWNSLGGDGEWSGTMFQRTATAGRWTLEIDLTHLPASSTIQFTYRLVGVAIQWLGTPETNGLITIFEQHAPSESPHHFSGAHELRESGPATFRVSRALRPGVMRSLNCHNSSSRSTSLKLILQLKGPSILRGLRLLWAVRAHHLLRRDRLLHLNLDFDGRVMTCYSLLRASSFEGGYPSSATDQRSALSSTSLGQL